MYFIFQALCPILSLTLSLYSLRIRHANTLFPQPLDIFHISHEEATKNLVYSLPKLYVATTLLLFNAVIPTMATYKSLVSHFYGLLLQPTLSAL